MFGFAQAGVLWLRRGPEIQSAVASYHGPTCELLSGKNTSHLLSPSL